MAAYAAVVSLMNTLLNIQNHHRFSKFLDDKTKVESLREKLDFLLDFIETSSTHSQSNQAQALESQIASSAFAAEDVIESHIIDYIHYGSPSLLDLQTVIQDMESVKEKVVIAKQQTRFIDVQPSTRASSSSTSSSKPLTTTKSRMVGLNDELIQLLDELTGHQSALQIIPIVGMGGIGKTTLATNAYDNQRIVQHFDIRAWASVSQQYTVSDIFSKLLSCYPDGEFDRETENDQLEERLYKSLIGRRYLIVLDDIWSIEAWHLIKRFFPDNNNRSRVVVTTRLSNIVTQLGTSPFQLGFLDEDKSWKLFRENASPGEVCPLELEELGKKIAKKCKGLPLLIVVIGALLRNSSVEYWEEISETIQSTLNSGEGESLDILSFKL